MLTSSKHRKIAKSVRFDQPGRSQIATESGGTSRLFNPFAGSISELLHPPAGEIRFLDGLRSLAILLVVSGHASAQFADRYGPTLFSRLPFVQNGWIGVDLFFVLSGFFIGGQLWKEQQRNGTVHIGKFMVRRGLRIWPLYYFVYACVLIGLQTIGPGAAGKGYGWSDLVFVTNFHNRGIVEGSWSLCTEEQFYIVTPLAIYLFARNLRVVERCRPWLWALFCAVPLLRAALWIRWTGHFFGRNPDAFRPIYYASVTHCDGLLIGLIIANLWVTRVKPVSRIFGAWSLVAMAAVATVALHLFQKEVFDFTALSLLFGSWVWLGLQRSIALFNSRVFYWISRLSFGMYLNHEYMAPWIVANLTPHLAVSHSHLLANLVSVAVLTILSATVALVTFCLIEHPFLQLRKVLLGRASHAAATSDFSPVTR